MHTTSKIVFTSVIGLLSVIGTNSKLMEKGDVDLFQLNNLDLMDFLSVVTGEIKIGNHTIKLPQDLPKLFSSPDSGNKADRRSYNNEEEDPRVKIKIKPFDFKDLYKKDGGSGWGWDDAQSSGWGWGGDDKGKGGTGLISVSNFFRLGCILFDLKEIKDTAENGLFGDKEQIKFTYKPHYHKK